MYSQPMLDVTLVRQLATSSLLWGYHDGWDCINNVADMIRAVPLDLPLASLAYTYILAVYGTSSGDSLLSRNATGCRLKRRGQWGLLKSLRGPYIPSDIGLWGDPHIASDRLGVPISLAI